MVKIFAVLPVKLQVYSANNGLAYSVIPQMMIAAPTMFVVVMASPNTKCASSSPNTTPVPLNMYARLTSIRLMICCYSTA